MGKDDQRKNRSRIPANAKSQLDEDGEAELEDELHDEFDNDDKELDDDEFDDDDEEFDDDEFDDDDEEFDDDEFDDDEFDDDDELDDDEFDDDEFDGDDEEFKERGRHSASRPQRVARRRKRPVNPFWIHLRGFASRWPLIVISLLCFCSGLAGLTYEVIWLRLLATVLGNASMATAAVLAAVMTGFGLGGYLAGRRADTTNPLRLYGLLEIALGFFALLVPLLAGAAGAIAPSLLGLAGEGVFAGVLRFLIAAGVVLLPACLMGATVPVLTRFAELSSRRSDDAVGPSTGLIYGLNTAGAALGCGLAGYLLLGSLGIQRTGGIAAALDVTVGVIALLLSRRISLEPRIGADRDADIGSHHRSSKTVLLLAAVSGGTILALEGLWTRLLLIVFGHDVHAFTSMLMVVLTGLAIGSAIFGALPGTLRRSRATLPLLFGLLGVGSVASMAIAGRVFLASGMDIFELESSVAVTRSHELGLLLQPLFTAILVLLPAIMAGAIFPALCAAHPPLPSGATERFGAGSRVGRVFAANTVGSLIGSIIPSLILIPVFGLQRSFVALGALASICVVLALIGRRLPGSLIGLGAAATVLLLAMATLAAPQTMFREILLRKIGPNHLDLLLYEEGRTGTVAVTRNRINGERQLFVNGVNEVTTRLVHDQSFKLLGHLGLLLHPDPEDVLVICLGAGLSSGAAATHDVRSIDIVDLERSVVSASNHFRQENNNVLADERVSLTFDDGRNYLRSSNDLYDVIVVDSTHPRAVDSWILYTREFYRAADARLSSDGIFVQWLPMHGLSVDEFRIIVNTFRTAFPHGTLWANVGFEQYGQAAYALLVGSRDGEMIDRERLAERLRDERIQRDLEPWGLQTPAEVLECFVAGPEALRRWVGSFPVNTDDLPITQFVTAYSSAAPMNAERLLEVRHPVDGLLLPPLGQEDEELRRELTLHYRAQGLLMAGMLERAVEVCGEDCDKLPLFLMAVEQGPGYFLRLRNLYPNDPERALEIAAGLQRLGRMEDAAETLDVALRQDRTNARLWLNYGLSQMGAEDLSIAERAFRNALVHNPELVLARINLGLLESRGGEHDNAVDHLERAVELDPELPEAHAVYGWVLLHTDQRDLAEQQIRLALELEPRHRDARINLGRRYLSTDRVIDALNVFRIGWRLYPYDPDILYNLGVAAMRADRPELALRAANAALHVNPEDEDSQRLRELAQHHLAFEQR